MIRAFFLLLSAALTLFAMEVISPKEEPRTEAGLFLLSFDRKAGDANNSYKATALGGYFGYRTRSINGAFLDFKLFSSNPVESEENIGASPLFDGEGKSIDSLVGAYIGMREGNSRLIIGRHGLATPLLNGDETMLLPYAYSGWSYLWDNQNGNKITMGQVFEQKAPDERFFSEYSPSGSIAKGVSYLGFEEEGETGMGGKLYLYRGEELYDTFYLEATDAYDVDEMVVLAGVQYVKTTKNGKGERIDPLRKEGGDDVELAAARLGFKYGIVGLLAAYSVNNGNDGLNRAYGGYADLFTTTMVTDMPAYGGPATTSVRFKFDWFDNASTRLVLNSVAYRESSHPNVNGSVTDDYTSRYADLKIELNEGGTLYFQYEDITGSKSETERIESRVTFTFRF